MASTPLLLTTEEAAEVLSVSAQFLRKHRMTGNGPPFVSVSRRCVRYRREDLDAWIAERLHSSTDEY